MLETRSMPTTLLDEPVFTRPNVAAIAGLSDGQLKGMLDRKVVELRTHNPGSGNPRLFSASDVIKIAVAKAMTRIGIPTRHLSAYAELIDRRVRVFLSVASRDSENPLSDEELRALTLDLRTDIPIAGGISRPGFRPGLRWILFPTDDPEGQWNLFEAHHQDAFDRTIWPVSYGVLEVDEIIQDTLNRIAAFGAGAEMPDRKVIAALRAADAKDDG